MTPFSLLSFLIMGVLTAPEFPQSAALTTTTTNYSPTAAHNELEPISIINNVLLVSRRDGAASSNELCADSNYENQGSRGSPLVDDCRDLAIRIDPAQKYKVSTKQRALARWGNCVIGFTATSHTNFIVGGADLVRWISTSIDRFGGDFGDGDKRVGSRGDVVCGGDWNTGFWGLYTWGGW